jgi:aldose 1-epimerase
MSGPELRCGALRVLLAPACGGAVGGFWLDRPAGELAILRPLPAGAADALHAAMFPMVPFANCIRSNRFDFAGRTWTVAPNMAGEPLNFHGSGWRLPWEVNAAGPDHARLVLRADDGIWSYEAVQDFSLSEGGLGVALSVTNTGGAAMPFGFGLHPWFARHDEAQVQFAAGGPWTMSGDRERLLPAPPGQSPDYSREAPPPRHYVNECHEGWAGQARIRWPRKGVALDLRADPVFGRLMVHVPAHDVGTFCLEPQSNAPYGFDGLAAGAPDLGIHILRPGETLSGRIVMNVSEE